MPEQCKLRVLMTVDAVGGVFNYAINLARELCRRGSSVTLACMGPTPSTDQRRQVERVPGLSLVHQHFALEWADEPWSDVDRAGEWLLRVAHDTCPDLVHLNGYAHGALPWPVPALVVAHSCVLSWWKAVFGVDAPSRYDTYRERVAHGLNAVAAVVAPSHSMLHSLAELYGYYEQALVIPNGVPLANYFPRPKRPFFLAAGRVWDEAKNIRLLASAATSLPWPVEVAGDAFLPLSGESVQYLGRLPHLKLAQRMSEAAVFLHPARYEPFGLSPLEAALSGAALVLGKIDSLEEVWGSSALYVCPESEAELVRVATRLAEDPMFRHSMAHQARMRARGYSVELMADRYTAVYRALLEQSRPTAGPQEVTQRVQAQA